MMLRKLLRSMSVHGVSQRRIAYAGTEYRRGQGSRGISYSRMIERRHIARKRWVRTWRSDQKQGLWTCRNKDLIANKFERHSQPSEALPWIDASIGPCEVGHILGRVSLAAGQKLDRRFNACTGSCCVHTSSEPFD